MTIRLSQPDFRHLTQIVQNLPDFATERDRRRLVVGAIEGSERANTILARLDLGGTPMGVAVEVIRFLEQFGQVAYGKEALGVFLNYIQPFVADEDAHFIDTLFATYSLDAPVTPNRPLARWRGSEAPAEVQEKIIGENTLRHLYMLQLALTAAQAVVHLLVTDEQGKTAYGTGFLVAPDLLMTNHHVIRNSYAAEHTVYSFNYQLTIDGKQDATIPSQAQPDGLFYTNDALDYTVVQLASASPNPPLTLQPMQLRPDQRVSIIQHPGGHFKQSKITSSHMPIAK